MESCFENNSAFRGSITGGEFLDEVGNYEFLKNFAAWSWKYKSRNKNFALQQCKTDGNFSRMINCNYTVDLMWLFSDMLHCVVWQKLTTFQRYLQSRPSG